MAEHNALAERDWARLDTVEAMVEIVLTERLLKA
jgi:hypothetical protein